jgi:hypothetical protein
MKKKFTNMERRGLPGGPNEMFTYVTGVFSTEGYRKDSPDVDNLFNIINSPNISMKDVEFPIMGIDNLGNKQIMYPGGEYKFQGDQVFEIPMFEHGGPHDPPLTYAQKLAAYKDSLAAYNWAKDNYIGFSGERYDKQLARQLKNYDPKSKTNYGKWVYNQGHSVPADWVGGLTIDEYMDHWRGIDEVLDKTFDMTEKFNVKPFTFTTTDSFPLEPMYVKPTYPTKPTMKEAYETVDKDKYPTFEDFEYAAEYYKEYGENPDPNDLPSNRLLPPPEPEYEDSMQAYKDSLAAKEAYDEDYNKRKKEHEEAYKKYQKAVEKDANGLMQEVRGKYAFEDGHKKQAEYLVNTLGIEPEDISWNDLYWMTQNKFAWGLDDKGNWRTKPDPNEDGKWVKPIGRYFKEEYNPPEVLERPAFADYVDPMPIIKPELTVDASLPEELEERDEVEGIDYERKFGIWSEDKAQKNAKLKTFFKYKLPEFFNDKPSRNSQYYRTPKKIKAGFYNKPIEKEQLYPEGFVPRFQDKGEFKSLLGEGRRSVKSDTFKNSIDRPLDLVFPIYPDMSKRPDRFGYKERRSTVELTKDDPRYDQIRNELKPFVKESFKEQKLAKKFPRESYFTGNKSYKPSQDFLDRVAYQAAHKGEDKMGDTDELVRIIYNDLNLEGFNSGSNTGSNKQKRFAQRLQHSPEWYAANALNELGALGVAMPENRDGGEQLPKAELDSYAPGGAYGPGDGLRRFLRNFDNTSIGFQPYSKLNPTAKSWTPKFTFNTVMGSPKKGFLDTAIEAGGDKEGFTGGLNARYFSPYLNKTSRGARFDARIDGDLFYDKGYTGLNLSAGPNFHFGSKPNRELKRGRARFDVQPFNLRIGAGWDPQSITNQSYDGSNVLSNTTAGTSIASENMDFEPAKHNFEMDWGYGASARGEWKPKAKWFPGTVFGEAAYNADLLGRNTGSISQETGNTYSYESGVNQETGINDGTGTVIASEIENTFKPQHKFNVKLGVRVPLDDIKFNRRRGRTPDELDEEISVRERKPKPEKEPKPKKEPKPIEVNEWARHPRWLQDGGEELNLGNINPNSRYGKWLTKKVSSGKYTYDSKLNKLMPKAQPGIETNLVDPLNIKSRIGNMIEGKTQEQAALEAEQARLNEEAEARLFKPEVKNEDPDKTSIGYYGDTFYLGDNRKINAASGQPIVPTRDLFGGRYSRDVAEDIIRTSKNAEQDPYTMLAIALQETLLGKKDNNLGHVKDPSPEAMPEDYIYLFKNKQDDLRNDEDIDYDNLSELYKIQAYNGLGMVYPDTEEDYHGYPMDYIYGVPLTEEGINMKEKLLYGKRITDLRDNVLKNNEAVKFLVDKYYNEDGGETDLYKVYSDFINGVYDGSKDYIRAEGIYDKLNRVHYKEAKESGMSIPNYIMTNVIKS